jgi:hypothetical protein
VPAGATTSVWYQRIERFFAFYRRGGEFTMPPRRDRQSHDSKDREVQRRRGRHMEDPAIERQMHDL